MSSTQEEVVDATVVPEGEEQTEAATSTSLALAPRQRRSEVIRALDIDQLVDAFRDYQAMIPRLLDDSDYQGTGKDRFKKKSAWRKIATAFDLDVVRVSETVERDDSGQPIRAMAIYRAIAPSGRQMDGDGYCSIDESRFSSSRGRQKLENDLRATATTRAKNRAIADLIGAGEVSAEEVDAGGAQHDGGGFVAASDELKRAAYDALGYMFDGAERSVANVLDSLGRNFPNGLPRDAGQAVVIVGYAFKAYRELAAQQAAGPPDDFDPEAPGSQMDMADARAEATGGGGHYDG